MSAAKRATGRGLGWLFPVLAMIALASCSTPADDRPSTFGEHLELAATKKYGGRVELIEPEILDLPIVTFGHLEEPLCVPAAEGRPEILDALGAVPIARVTFADGTALLLSMEAVSDDSEAIRVYVFTFGAEETCLRAVATTGGPQ